MMASFRPRLAKIFQTYFHQVCETRIAFFLFQPLNDLAYSHRRIVPYIVLKGKRLSEGLGETKQEVIERQIEELVKRRDEVSNPAEKQAIQAEIMKLFAQYERLKL
jgi:hypothetical protein